MNKLKKISLIFSFITLTIAVIALVTLNAIFIIGGLASFVMAIFYLPQSSSSNIQERPIGYAQVNFSQFVVLVFPGKNYPTGVIKDFSTNIIVNDRICLVSF